MLTQTIDVREAQTRLQELLGAVAGGGEITLTSGDKPIARLVPLMPALRPRVAGLHTGTIWASEDFDEPLPDVFWVGDV